jgi:hypothetical protein
METEHVPQTAHSLAFFPDGRALWCAQRAQIVVRAWPSLDVVTMLPIACTRLAAHPHDPLVCAAVPAAFGAASHVVELDAAGAQASAPILLAHLVQALAPDPRGGVLYAHFGGGNKVFVAHATRDVVTEVRPCWLDRGWSWLALLPRTQQMIAAVAFTPPIRFELPRLAHDHGWQWPVSWPSRAPWISVDAAADERALVVSDEAGATYALHLAPDGRDGRVVALTGVRGGTAHAVHPFEQRVVTLETSGRLAVSDLDTGALLDARARAFDAGARTDAL